MKKLRWVLLVIFIHVSLFAQTTLEKELANIKDNPDIKVTYLSDKKISLNYHNMYTRTFNIGENTKQNTSGDSVPKFIFNLNQMDTSLFKSKFKLQQQLPIAGTTRPPLLGDINNNAKVEFYGKKKGYFSGFSEVYCYEQNQNGVFTESYKYPSNTSKACNIYDIDRDGQQELHLIVLEPDTIGQYPLTQQTFFKKTSNNSLATQLYFKYNISTHDGLNGQLNDVTFGDFDKDSVTEAIFYNISPQSIYLVKFNKNTLTFDSLMAYATPDSEYVVGFTVGDFDLDSKTDIIYASESGNIYVLENRGIDHYEISWQGNSGVYNSEINFQTNDIDGNKKPEFWIGGQSFLEGFNRLVCYEMDEDNSFHPIAEIEFPGALSLITPRGQGNDVDDDGKDEIYLQIGKTIIIIKFTGSLENHDYQIYYLLHAKYQIENSKIYQFPKEKYPTIILSMTRYNNQQSEMLSWLFKRNIVTELKETESGLIQDYKLYNNYPNPFNPSTNIKFSIPESSPVKIKVYSSLGEEIITLLNNTLERGEHSITWNGTDKNDQSIPSGVYLITMEATNFRKTIKALLIK